jgi:hypothetical protein
MPEPIVKQDGTENNDCERNAAKRFVTKFRQDHPHLKVIVTEDSLSSNAPHIETLQANALRATSEFVMRTSASTRDSSAIMPSKSDIKNGNSYTIKHTTCLTF